MSLEEIERLAGSAEIDALLRPLEEGLAGLPELRCPEASVARLRNGNPALVFPGAAEFGDTAWVSHGGRAVAVGQLRGSELHPQRVFADEARTVVNRLIRRDFRLRYHVGIVSVLRRCGCKDTLR